jgi:hypothetical protein
MALFITLAQNLLLGYSGATLLFLIVALFYSPFRRLKNVYLSISNVVAMVTGILLAIAIIWNCFTSVYPAITYTYFLLHIRHIVLIITFTGILPLLFIYSKYRTSVPVTLVIVAFQYMGNNYELLLYFVTSFFRDYLPSGWSYYRSPYVEIICWPLGYFIVMLVLARIKMTSLIKTAPTK